MLNIADFMQTVDGQGVINILAADKLLTSPRLYATFLLWMLSELFETLPEVGDLDKPKLVFFFDEAHLLFKDAPKALVERIELVVRLVRSKGVGVYFVTQNPLDMPDSVLGQLGNRVQHALRAYTPRDQKAVQFGRADDAREPEDRHRAGDHRARRGRGAGQPARREGPAERGRARLRDAAGQPDRADLAASSAGADRGSLVAGVYEKTVDRESAYESLKQRAAASADAAQIWRRRRARHGRGGRRGRRRRCCGGLSDLIFGSTGPRGGRREGLAEVGGKSAVRSVGSAVGREIVRGVLGGILGGGSRRKK